MLNLNGSKARNEATVRRFVYDWMKLLAQGRLADACAQLDEPDSYGRAWTPERLLATVHETFHPGTAFYHFHPEGPVVTDPDELGPHRRDVWTRDDGTEYGFDCPVPLNHEWSDLTALFEFHQRPSGFAVILEDLHVL